MKQVYPSYYYVEKAKKECINGLEYTERLSYENETSEAIKMERDRLIEEVDNLLTHSFSLSNGKTVEIGFAADLTLINGKCLNNILNNDCTTRIPICDIHMKKFNGDADWNAVPSDEKLSYGLGLLHCEIKCFEFCLHLAYKKALNLKKWDCPKELKRKYLKFYFYLSTFVIKLK